jgi:hypothetical protein
VLWNDIIGHGKDPHDRVGTCLKQAIRNEQPKSNGTILQNAHDVVVFVKTTINLPHAAYDFVKL